MLNVNLEALYYISDIARDAHILGASRMELANAPVPGPDSGDEKRLCWPRTVRGP